MPLDPFTLTLDTKDMLLLIAIIVIELAILYLISRRFTQQLFLVFFLISRSRSVAVTILTLILFPGTVIHELAHLFTAEILGVRTGKLSLVPESIEEADIQSGSVAIAHTDPFRRAIIGLAPFLVGLGALTIVSYMIPTWLTEAVTSIEQGVFFSAPIVFFILSIYSVFAISNTMFSSNEDMKGVLPLMTVLTILGIAAYIAGFGIILPESVNSFFLTVLTSLAKSIGLVLAINGVGMLIEYGGATLLQKLLHVRMRKR